MAQPHCNSLLPLFLQHSPSPPENLGRYRISFCLLSVNTLEELCKSFIPYYLLTELNFICFNVHHLFHTLLMLFLDFLCIFTFLFYFCQQMLSRRTVKLYEFNSAVKTYEKAKPLKKQAVSPFLSHCALDLVFIYIAGI